MPQDPPVRSSDVWQSLQAAVLELVEAIREVHPAVDDAGALEQVEGWTELNGRPSRLAKGLSMIGCFYGPTGSGKSTLFKLISGIDVPASDRYRPTSYNVMVAVPERLAEPHHVEELFPDYRAVPLKDPSELRDSSMGAETLFYSASQDRSGHANLGLVLADVPDFDSIETTNWDKAEKMMRHADLIIFVVYTESYKNREVISQLRRCCRRAGRLIFLINKTRNAEQAKAIRNDLLTFCSTSEQYDFSERREDGQSLAEFLQKAPFYHCPFSFDELALETITPLTSAAPPFASFIAGSEAEKIVLESVRQSCRLGIKGARHLVEEANERRRVLDEKVAATRAILLEHGKFVAGTVFPQGRMMGIIIDVARQNRPAYIRAIGAPINWISKGIFGISKTIGSQIQAHREKFRDLKELETERMHDAVEGVINQVRAHPDLPKVTAGDAQRAIDIYFRQPLPQPSTDWDETVRAEALEWCRKNKAKTSLLGTMTDLLTLMGGSAIAVDFLFGGGLGTLGMVAAAGGGSTAAGIALKMLEEFGLRSVAERADKEWRVIRSKQIADDLEQRLAGPLFLNFIKAKQKKLHAAPLARCTQAADRLELELEALR